MKTDHLTAYEVLEKRVFGIGDFQTDSYVLRHKKSGARIAILENDDENKVFYIGFRTPPADSTGVAHILEHSVLCGSEKYPLKDPFVELVKGSLNTFLNAMTYPDKTVYPVASCNETDFKNLMDVYLDAVFHPNIYNNKAIFLQEGWHYEFSEESDALQYNGVVYNEMKGAFSNPDEILYREIQSGLYPDTSYGVESGGDPVEIPKLSYEEFLTFHTTYYHPSNSFIYLYGNADMEERLEYLDREYLSAYDPIRVESEIATQKAFDQPRRIEKYYPVDDEEEEAEKSYLSVSFSVGDNLDPELYVAFQILNRVICNINGSPLKTALLDAGLGKDVYSMYDNGIKQPFFSIVAKDCDGQRESEFLNIVRSVLVKIVKEGFDKRALLASLNYYEFKYLEADFGHFPKGLMYGLQVLDSWLFDETNPFRHIDANETFQALRQKVDTGYFESLVKEYLLDNPHSVVLLMRPMKGLLEQQEEALAAELEERRQSMSEDRIRQLREEFELLRRFQDTEDSAEELQKLPMLSREDLSKQGIKLYNEPLLLDDTKLLYHDIFTNGIGYLKLEFDLKDIPGAYYPYIGILRTVLFDLSTGNYTYGELSNEINLLTGGMTSSVNVVSRYDDPDSCKQFFQIQTKFRNENLPEAVSLAKEVLLHSKLTDDKRILEILREYKAVTQQSMMSAGHSVAVSRAMAYENLPAAYMDVLSGLSLYRLSSRYESDFDSLKAELMEKLETLSKMIFRVENLSVDFTGARECLPVLQSAVADLKKDLFADPVEKGSFIPVLEKRNEGLMSPSQVQYVCRAGNFRKKGLPYVGSLKALKVMMGYEYLWMNVRVKNGAYGCMCDFSGTGESYFVSYRDPNLSKTIEVYEMAAEYVRSFQADERTMTKYIIGAIGEMDTPMTPASKGGFSRGAYLAGETEEDFQRERDELLATTPEDIRALAGYIEAFLADDCLVVTGNSGKIREAGKLFKNLENLY